MTDYYELIGQVHEHLHEEQKKAAAKPRTCFFCEHMASRPGFCQRYNAKPPSKFMKAEGACDQWEEEIPF